MDSTKIHLLLERLESEIDGLEDSLAPLVNTELSHITSKLPLLDKAKLYVLVTYAAESVLFSYLRLNGINAHEHPVFRELGRVKQYFEKIKLAENSLPSKPTLTLDKEAASRFISAGLAANKKHDLEADGRTKTRVHAHFEGNKPQGEATANHTSAGFQSDSHDPGSASRKRKAETLSLTVDEKITSSPDSSQGKIFESSEMKAKRGRNEKSRNKKAK